MGWNFFENSDKGNYTMLPSTNSFNPHFAVRLFQPRLRARWGGLPGAVTAALVLLLSGGGTDHNSFGVATEAAAMGSRDRDPGPAGRVALVVAALEKEGFMTRADTWQRPVEPELGKALRVQLFKGHTYVIIALPVEGEEGSIAANVIDGTGRPVEQRNVAWRGTTRLEFTPDATGLYLVLVRNTSEDEVTGAVVVGYK